MAQNPVAFFYQLCSQVDFMKAISVTAAEYIKTVNTV